MADRIQFRGDTLENWSKVNPILLDREIALVATDSSKPNVYDSKKVGDGEHAFNDLPMLGFECLQELGDSTQFPVSQKVVSDNFTQIKSELINIDSNSYRKSFFDYSEQNGIISSSGTWNATSNDLYKHKIISISPGDKIVLKTNRSFYFRWFSKYIGANNGDSSYTVGDIQGIVAGEIKTFIAPENANCFNVSVLDNNVSVEFEIFTINGYDLLTDLQSKLKKIETDIYLKYDNYHINDITDFILLNGVINSSGEWNTNTNYKHIVLKVKEGDVVSITSGHTYYFYFLSEYQDAVSGEKPIGIIGELQACIANVNKNFIIPSEVKYMIVQIMNNSVVTYPTKLTINGYDLLKSISKQIVSLQNKHEEEITLIVDINGSGDFLSLRDAIEYCYPNYPNTSTSENKIYYLIKIITGTYDIRSYYTDDEWNSDNFKGIVLPRNCKLLGMGKTRSDVVITCTSETSKDLISTLNIEDDVSIENMTIYGNNIRYVIHDDYSYYPYSNEHGSFRKIKNVDFIGENLTYGCVYGSGTKGGANWHFKNCNFIGKNINAAFSIHDRSGTIGSTTPENYIFHNCSFISIDSTSIKINPMYGACEQHMTLIGCNFNGIKISAESDSTTKYNINGYGNNKKYNVVYSNDVSKLSTPKFSDETITRLNRGTEVIYFGDYVAQDLNGCFIKGTIENNIGTAIENIEIGEFGTIKLNTTE